MSLAGRGLLWAKAGGGGALQWWMGQSSSKQSSSWSCARGGGEAAEGAEQRVAADKPVRKLLQLSEGGLKAV